MKKPLLALAVATAGVCLITPKFLSDNTRTQLTQIVAKINDIPGYDLVILNTEQSWFSTSSTLAFGLDLAAFDPDVANNPQFEEMMEDFKFTLELDMQHGPILLGKGLGLTDFQLRIPTISEQITFEGEKVENIYLIDGKLNLFGDLSYTDSISPMTIEFDNGSGKVSFSGYSGVATHQNGGIAYTGQAASLAVDTPVITLSLSTISNDWTGKFDLEMLLTGLYHEMEVSLGIGKFVVSDATQQLVALDDLKLYVSNSLDENDIADMKGAYRIAKAATPIDVFEDIEIAFEVNNISQQAMSQYTDTMISLQDPRMNEEQLQTLIKPFVFELVKAEPEVKITNVGFTTAAGTLKSQADIKLADYAIDDTKFMEATFWQNNLLLNSSASLPKTLLVDLVQKNLMMQFQADPSAAQYASEQLQEMAAQQAEITANNLVQSGFLVEQNGVLLLNFKVKDGMSDLNGQSIPLAAILPAK